MHRAAALSCLRRKPSIRPACVRAYPVVERHRFIWLWMGDPALADPALVRTCTGTTIRMGRRRQDHSCQVRLPAGGRQSDGPDARDLRAWREHRQRRGGGSAVRRHPWRDDRDRDALDEGHRSAAVLGRAVAESRDRSTAGRSSVSRRRARSAIDVGVAPAGTGAPEGDRSQGVNGYVLNTITPETDKTCHYFWAFVRNYRLGRPAANHGDPRRRQPAFSTRTNHPGGAADARSTKIRTACSTISTSMPARCGRGA